MNIKKAFASLSATSTAIILSAGNVLAQGTTSPLGVTKPEQARIVDIGVLIKEGINLIIIVAGILVFIFLVWGGVEWLTSGGDKGKTENAQKRITAALTGLAIIAAAWAISKIITYFFGVGSGLDGTVSIPKPWQ